MRFMGHYMTDIVLCKKLGYWAGTGPTIRIMDRQELLSWGILGRRDDMEDWTAY